MTRAFGSSSRFVRLELDQPEVRRYIREVFEREFGPGIVQDVAISLSHPELVSIAVYLRERKDGMWAACTRLEEALQAEGIQVSVRAEHPSSSG